MIPSDHPAQNVGRGTARGYEVVHQDQGEQLHLLLLHHFQNASNQGIQIQNNYDKWH